MLAVGVAGAGLALGYLGCQLASLAFVYGRVINAAGRLTVEEADSLNLRSGQLDFLCNLCWENECPIVLDGYTMYTRSCTKGVKKV